MYGVYVVVMIFFFQAEDGIRDLVRSRGLGDVYKRQTSISGSARAATPMVARKSEHVRCSMCWPRVGLLLSLIHI